MDADGGNARQLVDGREARTAADGSPNGKRVVYARRDHAQVVEIATGEVTTFDEVYSDEPAWYDNDQLIV